MILLMCKTVGIIICIHRSWIIARIKYSYCLRRCFCHQGKLVLKIAYQPTDKPQSQSASNEHICLKKTFRSLWMRRTNSNENVSEWPEWGEKLRTFHFFCDMIKMESNNRMRCLVYQFEALRSIEFVNIEVHKIFVIPNEWQIYRKCAFWLLFGWEYYSKMKTKHQRLNVSK